MINIDQSIYSIRASRRYKKSIHTFELYDEPFNRRRFFKRLLWLLLTAFALFLLYLLFNRYNNRPIYRGIVDQIGYEKIKEDWNVDVNPITSGYYEVIGTNPIISQTAQVSERLIPVIKPENLSNCTDSDKFWHLDAMGYNQFIVDYIRSKLTGSVVVGILDTGIDKDHSFLSSSVGKEKILVDDASIQDINGHGTHVGGIVKEMDDNVTLFPIKIAHGDDSSVSNIDLIKGLAFVSQEKKENIDIINLSLGGYEFYQAELDLITKILGNGTIIIASAGNEGVDTKTTAPAGYKGVISVGSNDVYGNLSTFSNKDPNVIAPGECIYSTLPNNAWGFSDGTSMSSPILAGYISLEILQGYSPDAIKSGFKQSNVLLQDSKVYDLLNIKDQNNQFTTALDSTLSTLDDISKKTEALRVKIEALDTENIQNDYNNFKNSVKSDISNINTEAGKVDKLYATLGIKGGAASLFSDNARSLSENIVNILGIGSIVLPVNELGELASSLGVDTCNAVNDCGYFSSIIARGSKLPKDGQNSYVTLFDYQEAMAIPIYQGDVVLTKDGKELGNITVNNLPSRRAGEASVKVMFSINKYGVLSVKAVDESNGNNYKTAVIKYGIDYNSKVSNSGNIDEILKTLSDLDTQVTNLKDLVYALRHYRPDINYVPSIPSSSTVIPETAQSSTGSYKVSRVIDGDTIEILKDGEAVRVRLIGVDTPEYNPSKNISDCYGKEAANFLTSKLSGKSVNLEYDDSQGKYDKYSRELAYVFLAGENVNKSLLASGYAREYTYNKPYKYQSDFKVVASDSQGNNIGLWGKCGG